MKNVQKNPEKGKVGNPDIINFEIFFNPFGKFLPCLQTVQESCVSLASKLLYGLWSKNLPFGLCNLE